MDLSAFSSIIYTDFMGQPAWLWVTFLAIVFTLLFVDLVLLHKKDHVIELKESLKLSAFYVALGMLFGLWVWFENGSDSAANYYTVWLLEETLSMDNLFVMSIIFASFKVPRQYQHTVLIWGILGVIVLRGLMIGAGAAVVHEFTWVLLIFAAILVFTGIKMLFIDGDDEEDYSQKGYVKFLAKYLRVSPEMHGKRFFVKTPGVKASKAIWHATPLFLCLCVIELTDVMFAFDSVPAALAVTTDPYIVFTANIMAILGLRALFFAIEHILKKFEFLKYSLSLVLVFIGGKVFYNELFGGHISGPVSLGITVTILAGGVIASMLHTSKREKADQLGDH